MHFISRHVRQGPLDKEIRRWKTRPGTARRIPRIVASLYTAPAAHGDVHIQNS